MGSLFSPPLPPGALPERPITPDPFDPQVEAMRRKRLKKLKRHLPRQATILTAGIETRTERGPTPAPGQPQRPTPPPQEPMEPRPDPCEAIRNELDQVNKELDAIRQQEDATRHQIDRLKDEIEILRAAQDLESPPTAERPDGGSGGGRPSRPGGGFSGILRIGEKALTVVSAIMAAKGIVDGFERSQLIAAARQDLARLEQELKTILRNEGQLKMSRVTYERRLEECKPRK